MRLLLDTHVAIWALYGGQRLSEGAQTALQANGAELFLSLASVWEIAIKKSLGRDEDINAPESLLDDLATAEINLLPISSQHAWGVRLLERRHGDPFDRMIVTQARMEKLQLVTRDAALLAYCLDAVAA